MTIDELNRLDRAAFVEALGAIFENSPWVAERAWALRPFASIDALIDAMIRAVEVSSADEKLQLIRSHPDLAGKAARAGTLTEHSRREQSGAGLDRLSDEEFDRFHRLNDGYKQRFDFPFIIAVRDHTKESILEAFEERLHNGRDVEIEEALRNIGVIARFRVEDLLST